MLGPGDVVAAVLPLRSADRSLLAVLAERGVVFYPPLSAQLMTRSKALQAMVLKEFMVPETHVVHARRDLVKVLARFQQQGISRLITKTDGSDCGLGINLWSSPEELFNAVSWRTGCGPSPYPFVVQPFVEGAKDIRVILIGDYKEAYERICPYSFRNNMHFGGSSSPAELDGKQEMLCRTVMEKARFPYAHIDLLVSPDGKCFLSEIALNGGLRGARISATECREKKERLRDQFIGALGPC